MTLPLWGSRLIEASAGTGKTWTIAALYLRLVLGHGDGATGHGRALLPGQILVMTFTRAATRELSDRIRARLVEAAACFRGSQPVAPHDTLLRDLIAAYDEGDLRDHAAWRLAMAAEAMDDAAVHTIDAWCQRMLREHAFDSGSLFDEQLQANEQAMLAEACRDYWRQEVYPLADESLDAVLDVWKNVETLLSDVQALLPLAALAGGAGANSGADADGHGGDGERDGIDAVAGQSGGDAGSLDACRLQVQADVDALLARLKSGWVEKSARLRGWIEARLQGKTPVLKKAALKSNYIDGWFGLLDEWAAAPDLAELALTDAARARLSPEGMLEARSDPTAALVLPPEFAELQQLLPQLQDLPQPADAMRRHAAARVAQRVQQLKRRAGSYGFADMLERLDAALAGPSGERLRARITEQYPVALIDEFQDTSPLQYRIFDRLYNTAANARGSALFLIGDPKQSIYAFRGADIRSYLAAREATAGRHYLLGTNYRSTHDLVGAVNRLFERAEARTADRGAFLFRRHTAANLVNPLPFIGVAAKGRDETLVCAMGKVPALTLCVDAELAPTRDVVRAFAGRCAEHIVGLLNDATSGFDEPGKPFMPLRPADIAVLVRNGREAMAVRRALAERRVASVYLSDKESVFASREARDVLLWLQAVANPLDNRLARAALATATVGLPLAELAHLSRDDAAFEQRVDQLRLLSGVWRRQGVLPMLRRSLHELGLPARWLAQPDGERRLTNLLHLAELLQAAAAQLDGEQALIRWLTEEMSDAQAGITSSGDEQIVRLESDAGLVQVITVHKSKGLEFPVVCLPFACSFRPADGKRRSFVVATNAAGERWLDFRKSAESLAAADDERLQEDLRLLYVALTRARHALWLGVGAHKVGKKDECQMHHSALGQLLKGGALIQPGEIEPLIRATIDGLPGARVDIAADPPVATMLQAREQLAPLHDAPVYTAMFERQWSIASFSALVRDLPAPHAAEPARHVLADAVREEELLAGPDDGGAQEQAVVTAERLIAPAPWHHFPRGALAGNFLHEQLEWLAAQEFALPRDGEGPPDALELVQRLLRRCDRAGWGHRGADVSTWLTALVHTPLPPLQGASLAQIPQLLPEMEFWFPTEAVAAAQIDAWCRRHLLGGRDRPVLPDRTLRGMLMGFADLVFEHGGRYWVLDYKSNALGQGDADYHHGALEAAMAQHRYDVQAAIYLLALHRLLRARLGAAYDPARQLGGAIYLFMRGLRGPEGGCYLVAPSGELLDALDRSVSGQEDAGLGGLSTAPRAVTVEVSP
ncbi:MAG: exodeoxyribonuclease V subunit beta [Burkholderiales bacterium]|nr:exodeoxyribonuclease V subunit beta [Burkholderiales bacterium]